MHGRAASVVTILTGMTVVVVVGCAVWILRAPALPTSANDYIAANFIFEQSAANTDPEGTDGIDRPATAGAAPAATAPAAAAAPVDRSWVPLDAAPPTSVNTALAQPEDAAAPSASDDSTAAVLAKNSTAPAARRAVQGVRILQLGDSHTAADFFSGELRSRLQSRFGMGGPGYLAAGKPHLGVRSGILKVAASTGWTYQALQKSEQTAQFWLSGFNAVANGKGHTLNYSSESPIGFDSVEMEAVRQPHGGTIEVRLDGVLKGTFDLNGATVEPIVFRLRPKAKPVEQFRELEIRTTGDGAVVISSVAIYNKQAGVSLSSIGYPGATVSILHKFAPALLADDLRRMDPQIVILAFGTNEGAHDKLEPASYAAAYEGVIDKIKQALPAASIVLVGPPDGEERAPQCRKRTDTNCHGVGSGNAADTAAAQDKPGEPVCEWRQLPKLTEVRELQHEIAIRRNLAYWNWASIMPPECGAHRWATATPPLMAHDHVHFTREGYAKSADQFLSTLMPLVQKYRAGGAAVAVE